LFNELGSLERSQFLQEVQNASNKICIDALVKKRKSSESKAVFFAT